MSALQQISARPGCQPVSWYGHRSTLTIFLAIQLNQKYSFHVCLNANVLLLFSISNQHVANWFTVLECYETDNFACALQDPFRTPWPPYSKGTPGVFPCAFPILPQIRNCIRIFDSGGAQIAHHVLPLQNQIAQYNIQRKVSILNLNRPYERLKEAFNGLMLKLCTYPNMTM